MLTLLYVVVAVSQLQEGQCWTNWVSRALQLSAASVRLPNHVERRQSAVKFYAAIFTCLFCPLSTHIILCHTSHFVADKQLRDTTFKLLVPRQNSGIVPEYGSMLLLVLLACGEY